MSKISVTTIAGLTSGGDANKVIIESGDTLQVDSNATVGGTLGVNTTSGNEKLNVHGAIRTSAPSANFNAGLEGGIFDFTGSVARVGHVNGASGSAKDIQFLTAGTAKMSRTPPVEVKQDVLTSPSLGVTAIMAA